jgi:LPS-assembly protein
MFQPKKLLHCCSLLLACLAVVSAQQPENTERKVQNPIGAAQEESKSLRKLEPPARLTILAQAPSTAAEFIEISAARQEAQGEVVVYTGDVQASDGKIRLFADRLTYNQATQDVLAEGNVYFEQEGQRVAGERLEFNLKTRRGTIFEPTAFTTRTPDGTTLVIDAERADKTGEDTYVLEDAKLTACQEQVPKWSFTARRARIRLDDRAVLYHPIFRIKKFPILYLPFASISISKRDRSPGFLLPTSGSSNIKGRTLHLAYYQTLGRSADLLVRTDIFSKRGLGFGFDFRARPDENSRLAFGSFIVFDRLLGSKRDAQGNLLPDQGGSSFYADAVQYFKNGFVAVADVNITSSFAFRQVFAENAQQAISPEERSQLYINRNWRSFSFNISLNDQSTFIGNEIIKTRQMPSFELTKRSSQISDSLPVYFSFDAALAGTRRSETLGDNIILKTPSMIQRLDLAPRFTFPLRSLAGFTLTPSIALRSTFYSDSLDPVKREVVGRNLLRNYAEFELDFRPPAFAKVFHHRDGSPWFKHIIEPLIVYRRITGIDDFARTIRVDERDVIAETNEIEYGLINRFFVRRSSPDGQSVQAHELLDITLTQKYFFDPTFGGALKEGERNQFSPINTLSGFAFGGVKRSVSPLNVKARLRPTPLLFADVRLDYDTRFHDLRNLVIGGGITRGIFSISQSWYLTRRIAVDQLRFDPSTLPGNQLDISAFVGNPRRGPYGGFTLAYDLRDRDLQGLARDRRLINLTSTAGWAWDCCSFQVQHITFKAGLRNENRILFAFTLKGIGTFGTENIGQRRRR